MGTKIQGNKVVGEQNLGEHRPVRETKIKTHGNHRPQGTNEDLGEQRPGKTKTWDNKELRKERRGGKHRPGGTKTWETKTWGNSPAGGTKTCVNIDST